MFPETFCDNSVEFFVLFAEGGQEINPRLVSFAGLRGVQPVVQRQPGVVHVLLAAMLLLPHVVHSASKPEPQTPDVPAWFIYGCSYMVDPIWSPIYGRPYMGTHIWTTIYGRPYMGVHIGATICEPCNVWRAMEGAQ